MAPLLPRPSLVSCGTELDLPPLSPAARARRAWRLQVCQCAACLADRVAAKLVAPAADVQAADAAAGAPAAAAAPASTAIVTPVGAMLARHILRDGELVLLTLKPSGWFVLFSSLRFIGVVLVLMLAAIAAEGPHNREWFYIEAALFLVTGRIMWAVLQWMGRLYVLTDLRIIRLSGVFRLDIFDCALRRIARTTVVVSARERACLSNTGSIEITPEDESLAPALWQTVARPVEVNELICSAITKAKNHGIGAAA